MVIYYTKRKTSKDIAKKSNIDRVIVEPFGRWDKLYKLADNLEYVDCFIYDETSFKGLDTRELMNLYKLISQNDTIIMQVQ